MINHPDIKIFKLIKTNYVNVTAYENTGSERIPLSLNNGADLRLNPGDTLLQYPNGNIEIVRGNIRVDNVIYSIPQEAKIVDPSTISRVGEDKTKKIEDEITHTIEK